MAFTQFDGLYPKCVVYFCVETLPKRIENLHQNPTIFYGRRRHAMNDEILSNLYIDLQAQPPGDYCPVCGGERYLPSLRCIRCEGGLV